MDSGATILELAKYASIIGLFVAVVVIVWKSARWTGKVDARFDNIEKDLDKVDSKIGVLNEKVDGLPLKIKDIISGIGILSSRVSSKSEYAVSESPLTLTEKGVKLAKKLKVQQTIDTFIDKVDISKDASPFIIQNACNNFVVTRMMNLISSEERRAIEDEAYEDGGNLGDVLVVYSIMLRNAIFEARGIEIPAFEGKKEDNKTL